ncbi:hypothetical protein Tco_0942120 [Tanacetum coccineum]
MQDIRLDAGSPYGCGGFVDSSPDCTGFITAGTFGDGSKRELESKLVRMFLRAPNNMPPKRTSAATKTARAAAAAAAAAAPMTAAAVEQLVADRVSAALANHDTLRNKTWHEWSWADGSTFLAWKLEERRALRVELLPLKETVLQRTKSKFATSTCFTLGIALLGGTPTRRLQLTRGCLYAMDSCFDVWTYVPEESDEVEKDVEWTDL